MKKKRWSEYYTLSCCGEDITPAGFSALTGPAMSAIAAAEAARRGYDVYLLGNNQRYRTYCERFNPSGDAKIVMRF